MSQTFKPHEHMNLHWIFKWERLQRTLLIKSLSFKIGVLKFAPRTKLRTDFGHAAFVAQNCIILLFFFPPPEFGWEAGSFLPSAICVLVLWKLALGIPALRVWIHFSWCGNRFSESCFNLSSSSAASMQWRIKLCVLNPSCVVENCSAVMKLYVSDTKKVVQCFRR